MIRNKKTRGAVSVFLVMILVPCIVVTSLFVDLGRVQMSKSLATSASDLALNSLLTNYDADLNEWYGMVASCQNIEEFYEVSAQFFLRTISSQGLSDDEIILVSDYYANATNDDTIYDLLKVESQTAPSAMITEVENANLANATIIKDQIVEFMKYRAPIEITTGIIGMFTNEDGTQNDETSALIKSKENEPLVEEKQQFFAAEGELLTKAFYTYWAIRDYSDDANSLGLNNTKLLEYQSKINGYKTAYEEINNYVVKNLYNTSGLTTYKRPTIDLYKYLSSYSASNICSRVEIDDEGVEHYIINGTKVESLINDLNTQITNFKNKIAQFESATSSLMNTTIGTADNTANEIQWWVQMDSIVRSNDVSVAADNLVNAFAKVDAIDKCELDDDVATDWSSRASTAMVDTNTLVSTYLTAGSTAVNNYNNAVSKLETISANNINKIQANNLYVTVDGSSVTVSSAPSKIAGELNSLRAMLQSRVDELNVAINGNGDDIVSLTTLTTLASTYQTEFVQWKNLATTMAANDGQNSMAVADSEEANGKVLESKIDATSVAELKTRLGNIKKQLENLISAIDSIKYGSKKVIDITTIDTVKAQANTKLGSIPLLNGDLNNTASTTFYDLFKPTTSEILTLSNISGNSHNPDINPAEDNTVDTPNLYVYFHTQWKDTIKEAFDTAKEDEKSTKQGVEDYESDMLLNASTYRGEGTNIEKDFSEGNGYNSNLASLVSSIAGLVSDLVNANFDGIRDDIYVTTYTMEMFSYATFDYEAKYNLLSDEDKGKVTPSNIGIYDTVEGAADQERTWLSEDEKDSYNKTLTNKMINKSNNQAYLAEVEYILYGKATNEDNLKAAFGDIYSFRFALNTISGFQHFWAPGNNNTARLLEGIAALISSATCGVIPSAVIKAVLIPILASLETIQDNRRLAAGMPVEIYKIEADDWWISLPDKDGTFAGFFEGLKESIGDNAEKGKNKNTGLFYSDYLTIFVYLGLSGGGNVEEDMYRRMGEVIQSNMRMHNGIKDYTKSSADGSTTEPYTLKNSRVYFKLEATLRTEPLMIAMPVFNEYSNNMDTKTDWCTYKISTVRGYS